MLNADHLRTFVAVADTGSFTAAAARLGFTQPAVSQQIRALESQLGAARLFRRAGQRVRLTHAGEELLGHARDLIALTERAERHILGLQGRVTGRVELGCAATIGERLLPALLAGFLSSDVAVQFSVEYASSDRLLRWLGDDVVQVVIVDEHPRRRSFDVLPLGREAIVCLAARGHALLTATEITLATLREAQLILPPRGSSLRRALEDMLRRRVSSATTLRVALETDSAALAAQAAADGLGVAFVPQHRVPKTRDLAVLAVPGLDLEQTWYLVRSRAGEGSRGVDDFWNFVASPAARKLVQRLGLKQIRPVEDDARQ